MSKTLKYKEYFSLMRFGSIEIVLLPLLPSWASIVLASSNFVQTIFYMLLFLLGAVVMRTSGCIINDIFDRNIDSNVQRTKNRPLAAQTLTIRESLVLLAILLSIGLIILLLTNFLTIVIGIVCMIMIILYPLAKRFFHWPQLILGITFNFGVLMGYSVIKGNLNLSAIMLYLGCIFWTVGYDTIYAHQDRNDDIKLGVKSTALRFGKDTNLWIRRLYTIAITMWLCIAILSSLHYSFYIAILIIGAIFYYQYKKSDFDNPKICVYMFKINIYVGLCLFLGIILGKYLK